MNAKDHYIILEARFASTIVKEVQEKMKMGYIPQGGISNFVHYESTTFYCQAMILNPEFKNNEEVSI